MVYHCDCCSLVFSQERRSCPICSGRVFSDPEDASDYLSNGYSLYSAEMSAAGTDPAPVDPLTAIQQVYFKTQGHTDPPEKKPKTPTEKTPAPRKPAQTGPAGTTEPTGSEDFFATFRTATNVPPQTPPAYEPVPDVNPTIRLPQDDPLERELRELERERRRTARAQRASSFFDWLRRVRWRNVFRVVLIIALVCLAIYIWKMRHVIFSSILSFLGGLLPTILIIIGIIFLIRAMFR